MGEKKGIKVLTLISCITFALYIIYGIWGEKYLYADGSNYFYGIASNGNFIVYPLGRKTCDIITQLPAIMAFRLGCTSMSAMGALFGFGLMIWPVLFYALAMYVCIRYGRNHYAQLVFIMACVVMVFTGFYLQLESNIGLALFVLELVLVLLHRDEGTLGSRVECGGMILLLLLSVHMNEYFSFWGWGLAAVIVVRVCFAIGEGKRLHCAWLLMAIGQAAVAILSATDISARGEAPGLKPMLKDFLTHRWHIVWVLLIVLNVAISWKRIRGRHKEKVVWFLRVGLLLLSVIEIMHEGDWIASQSYPIRFTNLGWGIAFGAILLLLEGFPRLFRFDNMVYLCGILALAASLYTIRTACDFEEYNRQLLLICWEEEGFVEKTPSNTQYLFGWSSGMQAICVQGVRGIKEIHAIAMWDDEVFTDRDVEKCANLERYGITYRKEAFQ